MIRDQKLQYDINREAAKISAFSSGKIDKYEYLTGEEILPSNKKQVKSLKCFLDISNKRDKLKQIEGIFSQHLLRVNVLTS